MLWNLRASKTQARYLRVSRSIMESSKALLKIYADKDACNLALNKMKRSAKLYSFITVVFAVALTYFTLSEISDLKFVVLFLCLISAFMAWISFKSIPSYSRVLEELPLLYSFYSDGFIVHLNGEQKYSWENISKLVFSKTHLNLRMSRNQHRVVEMGFICISESSLYSILSHFKAHAPERLSKKITY